MHTYLALGDSYTIGEQVPQKENFPHQIVKLLRGKNINVADPVIIATTGWTTDELMTSIQEHNLHDTFSFVTLLIGVNNQYRGRTIENYKEEFHNLIHTAIAFAGGKNESVYVLSIPDWGATPFAEGRDRQKIAKEIDGLNAVAQYYTHDHNCHYIEITESTRHNATNKEYIAPDGLHPSGKEYAIWAVRVVDVLYSRLK
jgi:lysophospholipase L1-like esterase